MQTTLSNKRAWIGQAANGRFCLYLEDIDKGNVPVGRFPSIASAAKVARLNRYSIVNV